MDARAIENLIYRQSGLLGVSGVSSDMRALLASDDPRARFAVELLRLPHRSRTRLACGGAWRASMRSCSRRASASTRRRSASACASSAAWLGIELDAEANARGGPCISTASSKVSAWVIPTNEELMIARHTQATIG